MTSADGVNLIFLCDPVDFHCSRRCARCNSKDMAEAVADEKATAGLQAPETVHDEYRPEDGPGEERQRSEKALVRKLDCFIAPVMMLLMLISYLDRGNIGFAATQGMSADIRLKGSELNVCTPASVLLPWGSRALTSQQTAVSVFYIFYILAEFPTSILVKRLQFNRVIPTITFCWGTVCLCTGFVQSFGSLVVCRILLGFFEGCLFPAMTLFLCNWYKREELAVRIAFLFSKL